MSFHRNISERSGFLKNGLKGCREVFSNISAFLLTMEYFCSYQKYFIKNPPLCTTMPTNDNRQPLGLLATQEKNMAAGSLPQWSCVNLNMYELQCECLVGKSFHFIWTAGLCSSVHSLHSFVITVSFYFISRPFSTSYQWKVGRPNILFPGPCSPWFPLVPHLVYSVSHLSTASFIFMPSASLSSSLYLSISPSFSAVGSVGHVAGQSSLISPPSF